MWPVAKRRHITLGRVVVVAGALLVAGALAVQMGTTPTETVGWFALIVLLFGGFGAGLWAPSVAGRGLALRLNSNPWIGQTLGLLFAVLVFVLVSRAVSSIDDFDEAAQPPSPSRPAAGPLPLP